MNLIPKIEKKEVVNEIRRHASCAVFKGRIVVCGGQIDFSNSSNTVEAYDHVADSWSHMPSMIERRNNHKFVAITNKLCVVRGGNTTCEVFDSTCNKFVLIKPPQLYFQEYLNIPAEVISIGSKLLLFCDRIDRYSKSILFYDVDNDEWSEESWKARRNTNKYLSNFSCVKVSQ